ncbi:MAG: glucosamine-6-phosphate deaminase [Kiritimatiellae bacterium]|nr:glucosamine-6-phosphate deaminase [Kiritimatiellia bacterium]MDW8457752.1 glucosamine-6-phosphate deaminase [Verrucomicrobiota bacterium]
MEVIIQPDAHSASIVAARLVSHLLREKPNAVIGLVAGQSPLLLYSELVRKYRDGHIDFSRVTVFTMDDFVGIPSNHPASHTTFIRRHFLDHVNVRPENIHVPDGMAPDIPEHCRAYEEAIRQAGGIDLQILGIGTEGHLGFNEPTSSLGSRMRTKTITPRSRRDFAPQFGGEDRVPKYIMTLGLGTIMEARQCMLLAFGKAKANAIARTIEGPVTAMMPASILQMHPVVKVFLDHQAASLLQNTSYYQWVYDDKPEWQKF